MGGPSDNLSPADMKRKENVSRIDSFQSRLDAAENIIPETRASFQGDLDLLKPTEGFKGGLRFGEFKDGSGDNPAIDRISSFLDELDAKLSQAETSTGIFGEQERRFRVTERNKKQPQIGAPQFQGSIGLFNSPSNSLLTGNQPVNLVPFGGKK